MLFLGLLLMAVTGAFVGLLISENLSGGPDYTVTIFGNDIATLNTLEVFCAGLALALLFCIGLAFAVPGWRLSRRRRARYRSAERAAAEREAAAGPAAPAAPGGSPGPGAPAAEPTAGRQSEKPPRRHRGLHIFGH